MNFSKLLKIKVVCFLAIKFRLDIVLTQAEIDLIFKHIPIAKPNLLNLKEVLSAL